MSRRYPNSAPCPDCGLDVPATVTGELRSHVSMAIKAGRADAACASGSLQAQKLEAADHRRASKERRDEYRAERDRSHLPKHLQ